MASAKYLVLSSERNVKKSLEIRLSKTSQEHLQIWTDFSCEIYVFHIYIYTLTTYILFPLIYMTSLSLHDTYSSNPMSCWDSDLEFRLGKDSSDSRIRHIRLGRQGVWQETAILYQFVGWSFIVCIFHVPWNPKPQALSLAVQIVFILSPSLSYIIISLPYNKDNSYEPKPSTQAFWEKSMVSMSLAGISTLCVFFVIFQIWG